MVGESITLVHAEQLPDRWLVPVRDLLLAVDEEFVPPLSTRHSTHDRTLESTATGGIEQYLEGMSVQACVLAVQGHHLAALLSYERDPDLADIDVAPPSAYISTIAVHRKHRRAGLARSLYERLEGDLPDGSTVVTRTWSGNDSHIALLRQRGYSVVREEPNARGEGVSTVYYSKHLGGTDATT